MGPVALHAFRNTEKLNVIDGPPSMNHPRQALLNLEDRLCGSKYLAKNYFKINNTI